MKTTIEDLAILDGPPSFYHQLHVGRPNIGDKNRFLARVDDILTTGWLTNNGTNVKWFEGEIERMLGVRHCIAMCNATVALEIAIRALELNGEVIIPSFTFIATAHALQWQEITPVFCDVDPRTHSIDPGRVEELITPKTTGIIGVHLWGRGCDTEALQEIAERRKLKLLFDAAHAFACSHNGRMIGAFGEAEVFSFHATKFLNTFEGGAVVTNNDDLAKKIRLMNNFGFAGYDNVVYIGTNGKMSEVSAAMGLTGLENLECVLAVNLRNYQEYKRCLRSLPGVEVFVQDESEKCNYQYVVIEIEDSITGITRDQLLEILWSENVLARRYFYPGCHRMEPYRSYFPHAGMLLPETEQLTNRVLVLPTGTSVTEKDIQTICNLIRLVVENGRELSSKMANRAMEEAFAS